MRLEFTNELFEFLDFSCRESIISQILLQSGSSNIKPIGNFISRYKQDSITYIPAEKIDKVDDVWSKNRVPIKIGRFVKKFLTEFSFINFNITDVDIERFVNLYKSYFNQDKTRLRIVEGAELRKYYLHTNYHRLNGNCFGTLWNSCMRQTDRNRFLQLYQANPDDIKMLVYFDDEEKVRARALLWQNVKEHNSENCYKVMDRIYYYYDHDVNFFKEWAKENGYITKAYQNAKSESLFEIETKIKQLELYVILQNHLLSYAPYLDTFKFYYTKNGRFSNSMNYNYNFTLVQSDGSYEKEPEPDDTFYDEDN